MDTIPVRQVGIKSVGIREICAHVTAPIFSRRFIDCFIPRFFLTGVLTVSVFTEQVRIASSWSASDARPTPVTFTPCALNDVPTINS